MSTGAKQVEWGKLASFTLCKGSPTKPGDSENEAMPRISPVDP